LEGIGIHNLTELQEKQKDVTRISIKILRQETYGMTLNKKFRPGIGRQQEESTGLAKK
jgi:hypothetical protein